MRAKRIAILAGAAAVLAAGTAPAFASERNRMTVALPDGALAEVEYVGDVAPRVTVVPVAARLPILSDPFAEMERMAAAMQARHRAMMRQVAALQQLATQAETAPGMTLASSLPAGVRYTMVSSTTDANGCTRTVRYSSDGSSETPQVTRASAGSCAAVRDAPVAIPAAAPKASAAEGRGTEV